MGERREPVEPVHGHDDVNIARLSEDDIESYLTIFKRLMEAYSIGTNKWSFKLALQLTG